MVISQSKCFWECVVVIQYKKQLEKGQLLVDFEGFIAI